MFWIFLAERTGANVRDFVLTFFNPFYNYISQIFAGFDWTLRALLSWELVSLQNQMVDFVLTLSKLL